MNIRNHHVLAVLLGLLAGYAYLHLQHVYMWSISDMSDCYQRYGMSSREDQVRLHICAFRVGNHWQEDSITVIEPYLLSEAYKSSEEELEAFLSHYTSSKEEMDTFRRENMLAQIRRQYNEILIEANRDFPTDHPHNFYVSLDQAVRQYLAAYHGGSYHDFEEGSVEWDAVLKEAGVEPKVLKEVREYLWCKGRTAFDSDVECSIEKLPKPSWE